MASKQFLDGMTTDGVRYQLTTASDNTTTIDNITNWTQAPTEVQASDLIQGMVLECDHERVGTVHKLTNPNALLYAIRFVVSPGGAFVAGDSFEVNGAAVTGQMPNGEAPPDGLFGDGATVMAFLNGVVLTFVGGASTSIDYVMEETRIGTMMGKPFYRKGLILSGLPNNATISYPHGIVSIERNYIQCVKNIWNTLNATVYEVPAIGGTGTGLWYINVLVDDVNVRVSVSGTSFSDSIYRMMIWISYTKTTDSVGG